MSSSYNNHFSLKNIYNHKIIYKEDLIINMINTTWIKCIKGKWTDSLCSIVNISDINLNLI